MTNNTPTPRRMALYGIRNAIDGIRLAVDALILEDEQTEDGGVWVGEARDPEACPRCDAAREDVKDISTVDGTKRRHCEKCGYQWIVHARREPVLEGLDEG